METSKVQNSEKSKSQKKIINFLVENYELKSIEGIPVKTREYPDEDCFDLDSISINKNNSLIIKYLLIRVIYGRNGSIEDHKEINKSTSINLSELQLIYNEQEYEYTLKNGREEFCVFNLDKIISPSKLAEFNELNLTYKHLLRAEKKEFSKTQPKQKFTEILKFEDVFNNDRRNCALYVNIPEINGFENCPGITKLRIGKDVKVIESKAFKNCNQIKEITFEEPSSLISIAGFAVCSGIKEIVIPSSVEKISGFYNCTGLKRVSFKDDTKINEISGFQFCGNLDQIDLRYDWNGTVTNPSVAEKIKRNFEGVSISDVLEIKTNEDLKKISDVYRNISFDDSFEIEKLDVTEAFCNLEAVYLGRGVKSLTEESFCNCKELKKVVISEDSELREISGFNGNEKLVSINIPTSVKIISGLNFCSSLSDIKISENSRFESISGLKNLLVIQN